MTLKDQYRASFNEQKILIEKSGKISEVIRASEQYRQSTQLFVSLEPILAQTRINALLDGKHLILPSPGLKNGFYLLKPFTVPFSKLPLAVKPKGLIQFGKQLTVDELKKLQLELLLVGALTVDKSGTWLGDGNGFFDISFAILSHYSAISKDYAFFAAIDHPKKICEDVLPNDPWDIKSQYIVSPQGITETQTDRSHGVIHWNSISEKRIRNISPLWQIFQQQQ